MVDAHEEEISLLVRPDKKPRVYSETQPHSQEQAAAVTKVLEDDNLLVEILLCLGFPTTLVRAAFVSKLWLSHVSNPKFLSHFRKLHPPRLLGYYITEWSVLNYRLDAPRFIPMLPQPPELAAVIHHAARYRFGAHEIMHCQNGSVFTSCLDGPSWTRGVHRPLCAENGVTLIPPFPPSQEHGLFGAMVSREEGSSLSHLYLLAESTEEAGKSMVRVYMLQDGVWHMHTSATCHHSLHFDQNALLLDSKIYIPAVSGDEIIVLDLTDSSFSTIQLPKGVKYYYFKSILSRADDASSVFLIHVEGFQLRVWFHKGDNWLLVDTICLREMLSILGMSGHTLENEGIASVLIRQVGDNGQFVFLQMGQRILCLDIKCRTFCKVHENTVSDRPICSVQPFMMIWPPTFPALMDDPARNDVRSRRKLLDTVKEEHIAEIP